MELYQLCYNYVITSSTKSNEDCNNENATMRKEELKNLNEKNKKELLKMTAYIYGGIFFLILLFWLF